mgnify:CR=1 FL=1
MQESLGIVSSKPKVKIKGPIDAFGNGKGNGRAAVKSGDCYLRWARLPNCKMLDILKKN